MATPVTRRAHAKLNLALWVGAALPAGHEKAGFHPICSWMSCIDLFDEVTVEPLGAGAPSSLTIEWAADAPRPTPIEWPSESDLAMRALRCLGSSVREELGARVHILKRIPVGGGLGGGSSDGAAALLAAHDAFGIGMKPDMLRLLAGTLGSDVPFFVDPPHEPPRPGIVSGLGERVERLARVGADMILVVPPFSCATAPVYRAFDELEEEIKRSRASGGLPSAQRGETEDESLVRLRAARAVERHRLEGRFLFNGLTAAAARVEPRVRDLLSTVANITNCHTRLTGSGSCVFLPVEAGYVERVFEQLAGAIAGAAHPALAGCRAVRTRLL